MVCEESEKQWFQQFDAKWIHTELSNFFLQMLQILAHFEKLLLWKISEPGDLHKHTLSIHTVYEKLSFVMGERLIKNKTQAAVQQYLSQVHGPQN